MRHNTKTILVAGSTGLLGRGLEKTVPRDFHMVGVHLRDYELSNSRAEHHCLDILDKEKVRSLFAKHKFHAVVHCAGIANVDYSETHHFESFEANVVGTLNLIRECLDSDTQFIYVSSNAVFNGNNAPYSENSPTSPINKYGRIKAVCEALVSESLKNCAIARPIVMYGWNDPRTRQNPVTWLIEKLKAGQSLALVNDVCENAVYNIQCAQVLWEIIKRGTRGIVNIAGGEVLNRYDWALKTAEVFDLNKDLIKEVDSSHFPCLAPRPRNTSFRTIRMENELGIKPLNIEEGLRAMKKEAEAHGIADGVLAIEKAAARL